MEKTINVKGKYSDAVIYTTVVELFGASRGGQAFQQDGRKGTLFAGGVQSVHGGHCGQHR